MNIETAIRLFVSKLFDTTESFHQENFPDVKVIYFAVNDDIREIYNIKIYQKTHCVSFNGYVLTSNPLFDCDRINRLNGATFCRFCYYQNKWLSVIKCSFDQLYENDTIDEKILFDIFIEVRKGIYAINEIIK